MKNHRSNCSRLAATAAGFALVAALAAGSVTRQAEAFAPSSTTANIVETAVGAGSFKTLVRALEAADLVEALKADGPFTVFAPSDEAFAKLPDGALEELLRPENREKLRAVLLYHVVPGKVVAADVMRLNGREVKTLEGSKVKVKTKGGVMVNNARVVQTDVMTSNGVIHVIDTVIMPKMKSNRM
ncbi:MAG TPA: fasciclin domain-containing protein [Pyrinomonadaceae bacterium]|nr:fasciclin domain-containing protein [Pyrinomonadaceae bacterium]